MRSRQLITRSADAIVCVSDAIAAEMRERSPKGEVVTIANGSDFDDFAGLEHTASDRFRITHAGSFFGKRDPRPFLTALHDTGLDIHARFLGDFRSADREWAEQLGLGDRLELIPYAPRRRSLELQRDSEALLLLIPEAGGRGKGVLSGKVFEYLAAERPILALVPPDGAAAALIRDAGAGVVVAPEDIEGIKAALRRSARAVAGRRARRRRRSRTSGAAACRGARASRSSRSCWSGSREQARRASCSSRRSSSRRSRRCTGTSQATSASPTCSRSCSSPRCS